jgi:hypothetical protein
MHIEKIVEDFYNVPNKLRKHKNQIKMKNKKTIKLSDINPDVYWIETKIKGSKDGWMETILSSFTGKIKKMGVFGEVMTFEQRKGNKGLSPIVSPELVNARVSIWNKETKENEYFKIIF